VAWGTIALVVWVVIIGGALTAVLIGARRWNSASGTAMAELVASAQAPTDLCYHAHDVAHLPTPVVKYFNRVLSEGQPLVRRVRITHEGTFNASSDAEHWAPFRSVETFTTNPPGFIWDARIRMMPGVTARVRDSYVNGRGGMRAMLFGIVPLVDASGTPEITAGALQRYLAEAPWFPTALLPVNGVEWSPVGDHSAQATLSHGSTTVTLEFRFDEYFDLREVYTPGRFRQVGDETVSTPWSGLHADHKAWAGMRIPTSGEARWQMPGHVLPYWRGRVVDVEYEFEAAQDLAAAVNS
jgi:hypothetical protein